MNVDLYIFDEINVGFDGLAEEHIDEIIKETKLMKKGAHMTAAFQMKLDDGMVSHFDEDGLTYFYMLDKIIPIVEDMGYHINVIDERKNITPPPLIGNDFFKEYGEELYYYQVKAVNEVIKHERGIIEVATSGGKSWIAAALAKIYGFDFIIIVPTEKLVKQVYADFVKFDLDIGHIKKGMSKKRVAEEWQHKHMVCTWRMVNNNRDKLERFKGFIYDETHVMGDVMRSVFRHELSHALVRVGMTGSLPRKDPQKRESIYCHIGGETLIKVEPKELQDGGFISTCDIDMIPLEHVFDTDTVTMNMIEEWEWWNEEDYLLSNKERLKKIAEIIKKLPESNMLILCFKEFGDRLQNLLNYDLIHGDKKEKERDIYYERLEKESGYRLIATYDTVGTGTSINEINHLVTIDAGKNETRIIQGIGRGLRKDGKQNHLKVTDLYSDLVYMNPVTGRPNTFSYSRKHANERKKEYKRLHYPFKILSKVKI